MSRLHAITGAVVVVAIAALAMTQSSRGALEPGAKRNESDTIDKLVADLRSEEAPAAEKELFRRLNLLSADLTKVAFATQKIEEKHGLQREPVDRALAVLGMLDHRKITRLLMINVCYCDNSVQTEVSLTGGYPCAMMLRDLGPTAVYEIIKYLERPPVKADLSDGAIDLFARVCFTAFPSHDGGAEEAKGVIVRARRRARNTVHIERLEKSVKALLQTGKPDQPANPNVP